MIITGNTEIPYSTFCKDSDDTNKKQCYYKTEADAQKQCNQMSICTGYGKKTGEKMYHLYKSGTKTLTGSKFWKK